MTTFVSVGNATQPFNRLIEAVIRIVPKLPQPVVVQHGNSPFQEAGCISRPFMEMTDFIQHVEAAELLILHAGAGSVIHAIQAGKVPVIMPRREKYGEHIDDHQLEFARALSEEGKVIVVEEPADLEGAVNAALALQRELKSTNFVPPIVKMVRETLDMYAKGRFK